MRQLITRIDDDLHRRLKERAADEGRSVNSLVTNLIADALAAHDERARVRMGLEADGLYVAPPQPSSPPTRDAAIASTRGAGNAASVALEEERGHR